MLPVSVTLTRLALTTVAAAAVGLLGIYSTGLIRTTPIADLRIEPATGTIPINDTFTTAVVIESDIAVNAFSGQLQFDPTVLAVAAIDYNTSIADLWVTEPWYSNGAGTINFAGGTTQVGGFTGTGNLITITFRPLTATDTAVKITEAGLYQHDGFGTDVPLDTSVDALFSVEMLDTQAKPVPRRQPNSVALKVATAPPNFDLNQDGVVNLRDVSILMLNLFSNESRYDFNQDGLVNITDLNLLLQEVRRGQ